MDGTKVAKTAYIASPQKKYREKNECFHDVFPSRIVNHIRAWGSISFVPWFSPWHQVQQPTIHPNRVR